MIEGMTAAAIDWARRFATKLSTSGRARKRMIVMLVDSMSCVLAVWLSFSLRLGYWQLFTVATWQMIATEWVLFMGIFMVAGVYNNIFRYHGPRGIAQIALCCSILMLPSVLIFGLISIPNIPRTTSVLFPLIFFALVALSRIIARYILVELAGAPRATRRVLIYGAGSAGRQLAASIAHERDYHLVGFVDDDPELARKRLEGSPIFAGAMLEEVIRSREVGLVLLAMPSVTHSQRAALVRRLQNVSVEVRTLPGIGEILEGQVTISDLRKVEVTDLLSRDPVEPDESLLASAIAGKTVLVSGAGGSIGSELCRQIVRLRPVRLVLAELSEAALFDIETELRALATREGLTIDFVPALGSLIEESVVQRLFERWRPQTVFHAAAYKHVPLVEANPLAGVRNNVLSTQYAALAACAVGVERFILVSTDKAVRPTNVMGASKRVCELILQALSREDCPTVFAMVRFGNVLGSSGSVVPQFLRQIAAGGPVTVTHREVTRFFMTIPEAANLVIQAGTMAEGGDVFLLDMGEPVRIYDLATSMIRLSGRTFRDESNPDGDIEVVEIGLRPGEKLYEELLIGAEAHPTRHERIFRAEEPHLPWKELSRLLERMRVSLDSGDREAILDLMRELVSGYRPDASEALGDGPHMLAAE